MTDKEENIFCGGEENEKAENIWRRKIFCSGGEEKRKKIFGEVQIICLEEKEKEENIVKKENKLEENKNRRKRRTMLGEGKNIFLWRG